MMIGDIAEVNPRYTLDKDKEYPFVEMAAVAEGFGGIVRFDSRKAEASGLARFKLNDILFGKITPCAENGKVALVKDLPGDFGLGSTEFIVLSPRPGYDPRFVYALLCSNQVLGRAISRMEGSTGRLRVTEDTFTKWLTVAVPPQEERKVVAQVLDAMDTAIERIRTAIEKARHLKRALAQTSSREALATTLFSHSPCEDSYLVEIETVGDASLMSTTEHRKPKREPLGLSDTSHSQYHRWHCQYRGSHIRRCASATIPNISAQRWRPLTR